MLVQPELLSLFRNAIISFAVVSDQSGSRDNMYELTKFCSRRGIERGNKVRRVFEWERSVDGV